MFTIYIVFLWKSLSIYSIINKCEREGKNDGIIINGKCKTTYITHNTHTGVLNKMETTPMVLRLPFLKYHTVISNSCTYHLSLDSFLYVSITL